MDKLVASVITVTDNNAYQTLTTTGSDIIRNNFSPKANESERVPVVIGGGVRNIHRFFSETLKNYEIVQAGSASGTYGTIAYSLNKRDNAADKRRLQDGEPMEPPGKIIKESRTGVVQQGPRRFSQSVILNRNRFY